MKTIHLFIIFIVVILIQLFVPAKMIFSNEDVLKTGTSYKFKTRPVDPNDPFRGKYITLQYDINVVKTEDTTWQRKDKAYVYLNEDSKGFASVNTVSKENLRIDKDYVVAEVSWYNRNRNEISIKLPFERYYMEETKAYDAEIAYREAQRDSLPDNIYALVHIKEGTAVLSDVIINNISIKDYVKKN